MAKFIVSTTQVISQNVQFVVDLDDSVTDQAKEAREQVASMEPAANIQLYESEEEVYHINIVTNVRLATEEESK